MHERASVLHSDGVHEWRELVGVLAEEGGRWGELAHQVPHGETNLQRHGVSGIEKVHSQVSFHGKDWKCF